MSDFDSLMTMSLVAGSALVIVGWMLGWANALTLYFTIRFFTRKSRLEKGLQK